MLNLYVKKPTEPFDTENFTELLRGDLRLLINSFLKDNFIVYNDFYLGWFVKEFITRQEGMRFIDEYIDDGDYNARYLGHWDEPDPDEIKLMSLQEVKNIFREELEYWVIFNRLPTYILLDEEFARIKLMSTTRNEVFPSEFKEQVRFIMEHAPKATRINIDETPFTEETNLIAVYKIK